MDKLFEQEIKQMAELDEAFIDTQSFLDQLHSKQKEMEQGRSRIQSGIMASVFIFFLGFVTMWQLDPTMGYSTYWADTTIESTYFDMDLWETDDDVNLRDETQYYDQLVVLLLEEDEIWSSVEFLDEINYLNEEEL